MRTLFALSISLVLSLLSLQSFARDYIVEAIIFTNESGARTPSSINPDNGLTEGLTGGSVDGFDKSSGGTWIATEPRIIRAQTRLDKSIASSSRLELLNATKLPLALSELASSRQALDKSPDHRVLQALSWTQAEADFSNSPLIDAGDQQMLSGTIRVYAPSLLFAELILRYAPGDILNTPDPTLPQSFIDEQRKLKLNEIHYFDQSDFGVILTVRPKEESTVAK